MMPAAYMVPACAAAARCYSGLHLPVGCQPTSFAVVESFAKLAPNSCWIMVVCLGLSAFNSESSLLQIEYSVSFYIGGFLCVLLLPLSLPHLILVIDHANCIWEI